MTFKPGDQIRCPDEIVSGLADEEGSITIPAGAIVTVVDRPDLTEGEWEEDDGHLVEMVAFSYEGKVAFADASWFSLTSMSH
ncbi:hypothetical protein EXS62_01520 [Candidatus Kaiserbacteria bacterium]|nr:hypothetical protein [Candidatus Kaiserbacteria bacterium]